MSCQNTTEVSISKSNRVKLFLGKGELNIFNYNKIVEVYKDLNTKPEIYIIPISTSDNFNIYVEIPLSIMEEKRYVMTANVFGSYLIFDKKINKLYRIDSETACGSVYKKNKKVLVIKSYFGELKNNVFVLDKNLNSVEM